MSMSLKEGKTNSTPTVSKKAAPDETKKPTITMRASLRILGIRWFPRFYWNETRVLNHRYPRVLAYDYDSGGLSWCLSVQRHVGPEVVVIELKALEYRRVLGLE